MKKKRRRLKRRDRFNWKLGDVIVIPPKQQPKKEDTMKKIPSTQNGRAPRGPVIRVAALKNPKTGKTILVRVTADGRLDKRTVAHLGIKRASSWLEVEAARWAVTSRRG